MKAKVLKHLGRSTLITMVLAMTAEGAQLPALKAALTHHVSFDDSLTADYSVDDKIAYWQGGEEPGQRARIGAGNLASVADGRFGAAVRFTHKNPLTPYYRGEKILAYQKKGWSGSVSVWLRLDPDQDLEPGYCDPVQIIAGDNKNGFIFLEWTKDDSPRKFRYVVRPRFDLWNPDNMTWGEMPDPLKPMVQLERPVFKRSQWTHVVFTFDQLNSGSAGVGKLYLDGEFQGKISDRMLDFGWDDPRKVLLALGASYVGDMDDLSVFNRALSDSEVAALHHLPVGVREIYESK